MSEFFLDQLDAQVALETNSLRRRFNEARRALGLPEREYPPYTAADARRRALSAARENLGGVDE